MSAGPEKIWRSILLATSGEPPRASASDSASLSSKSLNSIRFPMLNGVSRVSRIKSLGVATPIRQNANRLHGILRSSGMAFPNRGKEFIGAERQASDHVHLSTKITSAGAAPASVRVLTSL